MSQTPSVPTPPAAYEFHNLETGHAIVDYSEHTYVGRLTAEKGYVKRPLMYANSLEEDAKNSGLKAPSKTA